MLVVGVQIQIRIDNLDQFFLVVEGYLRCQFEGLYGRGGRAVRSGSILVVYLRYDPARYNLRFFVLLDQIAG